MATQAKKKAAKRLKKPEAGFRIVFLKPKEKKTDIIKKRVRRQVKKANKKLKGAGKILKKAAQKEKLKTAVRAGGVKLVAAFLVIGLNWAGLAAVGETFAAFNDVEISGGDSFAAGTLDFNIAGSAPFPVILPDTNSVRTIEIEKTGTLDFQYRVRAADISGALCSSLNIKDNIGGNYQPLSSFVSTTTLFSLNDAMTFTAQLTSGDAGLMNQTCEFNLIFSGWQENLAFGAGGFTSEKTISNTINSGSWGDDIANHLVINEVYYDVDAGHGQEGYNEWIELYNPTNNVIDLTGWQIWDNNTHDTIPATTTPYTIQPNGYAVITASSTTWSFWSAIPGNATKIVLNSDIGNGLGNDGDVLKLRSPDPGGVEIDAMSYGNNINGFDPSCVPVHDGHSFARTPAGKDTGSAADWEDLASPNPGTNPHTVLLNEILPNPAGEEFGEDADPMPKGEWVEIYNYGEYEIDLSDWKIRNQMGRVLAITAGNTSNGSAVIHPGEWLVVYRDGSEDFEMLDGGDTITLADEKDRPVDSYTFAGPAPENKSYARIPDFSGDWVDPIPTPGKTNQEEEKIKLLDFTPENNVYSAYEVILNKTGEDDRGDVPADAVDDSTGLPGGEDETTDGAGISLPRDESPNQGSDVIVQEEAGGSEAADPELEVIESEANNNEIPAAVNDSEDSIESEEPAIPDARADEIINNTENNEATVSDLPPPADQAVSEPAVEPAPINIPSESASPETGGDN